MSTVPEMMAAAAADVAAIGSTVNAAHLTAAASTVGVIPPGADQVSAAIAQVFSGAAQEFQGLLGKATAFGAQFAQQLHAGAGSYSAAEAVNAASVMPSAESIVDIVNGLAAPYINQINTVVSTVTYLMQKLQSAITLAFLVPYEALVLTYLTLALLIGAIQLLEGFLGISIPVP
ncbi:PE family protein [Mycobacterium sp. E3198]|uniref:PE family protein n=1 Tax=Mycobacterium sp. E3198 TaxID=1834143 RepID=UPI0018D2F712|nr:PE family protein [Mycobacterium sp. E3198]